MGKVLTLKQLFRFNSVVIKYSTLGYTSSHAASSHANHLPSQNDIARINSSKHHREGGKPKHENFQKSNILIEPLKDGYP